MEGLTFFFFTFLCILFPGKDIKPFIFPQAKNFFLVNNNLQTNKYNLGKIEFFLLIKFFLVFHFRKVIVKFRKSHPHFFFVLF